MKKLSEAQRLLRSVEFSTKVYLFFATPSADESYDPYEKNLTYTNLNPITVKAYVHEVSPSSLVFKEIGLHQIGAVEVVTEDKYVEWFEQADRIVIRTEEYQVFRQGTGSRTLVQRRPYQLARIFLTRKE